MWPIIEFLGSPEFLVWIIITILSLLYRKLIERFFRKNTVIKDANNTIEKLRTIKYKSIDEQKKFLRAKNDSGNDFINVVVSIILFVVFFKYIFIPRMPNIYVGLGTVFFVALVMALINSLMYPRKARDYQLIISLYRFVYGGTLFLYLHFISVEYPLILILFIIILLIGFEPLILWIKNVLGWRK